MPKESSTSSNNRAGRDDPKAMDKLEHGEKRYAIRLWWGFWAVLGENHNRFGISRVTTIRAREHGSATNPKAVQMSYPDSMDHLNALREKIGRLRAEIADNSKVKLQFRLRDQTDTEAQVAHGQRHERLQAIQQQLAQLAGLGRKVLSVEEMKEKHRYRLNLVKKAS